MDGRNVSVVTSAKLPWGAVQAVPCFGVPSSPQPGQQSNHLLGSPVPIRSTNAPGGPNHRQSINSIGGSSHGIIEARTPLFFGSAGSLGIMTDQFDFVEAART